MKRNIWVKHYSQPCAVYRGNVSNCERNWLYRCRRFFYYMVKIGNVVNYVLMYRYISSRLNFMCYSLSSWAQRLINLEIPVLVRSLKSSNVELGYYLDGRLFKCCLSAAANP